jgi:hypothetical protein
MRRFLAWLTCAAGAAWIVRRLRRSVPETAVDPADELRRTLDASRTAEPPSAEPPERPEVEAPDLDQRRRAVHDRGRSAIDEMRGRGGSPE